MTGRSEDPVARAAERFGTLPDEYAERWRSAGLWMDRTLHDLFDETVSERAEDTALVTRDQRFTFSEFKDASDNLAAGLRAAGIGRGDLVTVQLPNWPEFCFLQIALSRVGAVIQPLHMVYRRREMHSMLAFCESDAVIVADSFDDFPHADAVRDMTADLPALRCLIVARGEAGGPGEFSLDGLAAIGRQQPELANEVEVDPDEVFYMNFTSGTEGNPKGFMHTHNTLLSAFGMLAQMIKAAAPETVTLANSPMTHSFGHFTTYQTALAGVPMVLVDRYRPVEVLELIEREHVTSVSGTPAHLYGILNHPDFEQYDTSSVTSVGVGGARCPPELLEDLERVWGAKPGNAYGLGENIVHTRTMPWDPDEKIRNTVGKPLPGMELRIVDPNNRGIEMPVGEIGEIAFRGPTLFVGYFKQPDLTKRTRDDDGWFYTGDLGSVDDEGYLCFAGRRGEVINRGGTKIYPKEIEDLLLAHPAIQNAAVVGMPDSRLGERVCAYLVLAEDSHVDRESLDDYLCGQQGVMKHKVPEDLVILDELPMTPTGKIRKAALQADAQERASKV